MKRKRRRRRRKRKSERMNMGRWSRWLELQEYNCNELQDDNIDGKFTKIIDFELFYLLKNHILHLILACMARNESK